MPLSPMSPKSVTKAPTRRTRWRSATTTRRNGRRAARMRDIFASAWRIGTPCEDRRRSLWPGTMLRPWKARRIRSRTPVNRARVGFEFVEKLERSLLLLSRPRRRARRRNAGRIKQDLDAVAKVLKEEQQRTGVKLLWAPPTSSAILATCTAPPQAATPMLSPSPPLSEEGHRGDQGTRRRRLRVLGGPSGYQWPLEHRHEARSRAFGRLHAHGRRLRQEDWLQRPVLLRAQAQGNPTKHQYDSDSAACINFLRAYGLADHVKMTHRNQPRPRWPVTRSSTNWITPLAGLFGFRPTPTPAICCWAGTPINSPPTST